MYIRKVDIQDVRGLHDIHLNLKKASGRIVHPNQKEGRGEWIVIAGPNGSGKTTLLRAIAATCAGERFLDRMQVEHRDWISIGAKEAGVTLYIAPSYEDSIPDPDKPTLGPDKEVSIKLLWLENGGVRAPKPDRSHNFISTRLYVDKTDPKGWMLVGLGASRTRAPSTSLAEDMLKGPARRAALVSLFRADATLRLSLDWIQKEPNHGAILSVFASLGTLVLNEPTEAKIEDGEIVLKRRDRWIRLSEIGQGVESLAVSVCEILRRMNDFFGVLREEVVQNNPEPWRNGPVFLLPGVVLIDEAENHLHPQLQQRLGEWLRLRFPNIQFIVTTHSPYIAQTADRLFVFQQGNLLAVESEEAKKVVNGTADDAIVTKLFGLNDPYSPNARLLRDEITKIEIEMQRGEVSLATIERRKSLLKQLPDSMDYEVAASLRRLEQRR